jgi:flagella basal body P-ring formation protein FlgA
MAVAALGAATVGCSSSSSAPPATTGRPTTTLAPNAVETVYVATRDIPACASVDELLASDAIRTGAISASQVPAGTVTDLHQLAGRFTSVAITATQMVRVDQVAKPPVKGC